MAFSLVVEVADGIVYGVRSAYADIMSAYADCDRRVVSTHREQTGFDNRHVNEPKSKKGIVFAAGNRRRRRRRPSF